MSPQTWTLRARYLMLRMFKLKLIRQRDRAVYAEDQQPFGTHGKEKTAWVRVRIRSVV